MTSSSSRLLASIHSWRERTSWALLDQDGEVSYADLWQAASHVAAQLAPHGSASRGLEGQRVALFLEPSRHFISGFAGILLAGGCVVVLSPLHSPSESAYFLENAHIETILSGGGLLPAVRTFAGPRRVLDITKVSPVSPVSKANAAESASPGDHATVLDRPLIGGEEAPALQLYTSGTTGKPKGAVLTHGNLAVQQTLLRAAWGFTESDELLHVLPLHHMHGLCIALLTALGALSRVRMLAAFDGPNVWESLAHCTSFMAVPTIYAKLFTSYDAAPPETRERWRRHAKGLRLATSGSAALPVSLARRWHDLTGTIPLERFGMTELGVALSNPLNGPRREGSIGKPLPTVDIRIVNDQGEDASQGELWVAGPSVFQGYFEKPEANASAFVDQEGKRYFRTGDTVERSPDGYVRVLGRTSVDILKSGGYKLSALEIEEVLREADAVAEVAVVGLPDETWGERVVACVVAKPGRETECDEVTLRAFAKTRLASYKVPKNVLPMTELPRNAMGKVIKPELVRLISKGNEHRSTAETKSASTDNDSSAKTR